jgi:hypothetical protein
MRMHPNLKADFLTIRDFVMRLGWDREDTLGLLCAVYAGFALMEIPEGEWPGVEADELKRTLLHLRAVQKAMRALSKKPLNDMPCEGRA